MTNQNQSKSDERIRKLNERCAQLQAEAAQLRKETEKLNKENAKQIKETRILINEVSESQKKSQKEWKKIRKQFKETGKQIDGLGNRFGDYTEAMARPSIRRILKERFNADYLGPLRYRSTDEVEAVEVDAWGLSRNGTGAAYIVETKSKFRDEHIEQVLQQVERFRYYMSDYDDRAVYPILAVVDISEAGRRKVWDAGIYLLDVNDGVFKYLEPPEDFEANGDHGAYGVQRGVPYLQLVVGNNHKKCGTG